MQVEEQSQEKGLFTFYKQQQGQDKAKFQKGKKVKRIKMKKSKKNLRDVIGQKYANNILIKEHIDQYAQKNMQKDAYSQFMKNILMNNNRNGRVKDGGTLMQRMKTEPMAEVNKQFRKKESREQARKKYVVSVQEIKLVQKLRDSSEKGIDPSKRLGQLLNDCRIRLHEKRKLGLGKQSNSKQKQVNLLKISKQLKEQKNQKSFLQKLKHLDVKSRSNLISSKEREGKNQKKIQQNEVSYSNKKYLKNLINDFYVHSDMQNQYAYKLLRETLKFPEICSRLKQLKTQGNSPQNYKQSIKLPTRSASQHNKHMRIKHSNVKSRQLYKINLVAQLSQSYNSQSGSNIVSLIDMNKNYWKQGHDKEWQQKRKLIKSRLGLQL